MNRPCPTVLAIACAILCLAQQVFAQSPYEISWKKDAWLGGSGLLALAVGAGLSANTSSLTEEEINALSRDQVNAFDRPATYNYSEAANTASEVTVWTCMALPLSLLASERMREDAGTLALMYAETMLLAQGLTHIAKGAVQRVRPYAYNPEVPLDEKTNAYTRKSFYSSHTTNAFASAVFFATVYSDYFPDSKWKPHVWTGALLVATATGYFRFEAGMHFPTDVLVGAAMGAVLGRLLPRWHRTEEQGLNVAPASQLGRFQIKLRYKF